MIQCAQIITDLLVKGDYVVSVPLEINNDATELINVADQVNEDKIFFLIQQYGYVSAPLLATKLNWNEERFERAIVKYSSISHVFIQIQNQMVAEGLAWVDAQTGGPPHYYFASMWAR